jgi:hypothetical protein
MDADEAALGRLVCETVWPPSSLLPQFGVRWEALDDESARATLKIGEETIALTLFVEPDGKLRERFFRSTPFRLDHSDSYARASISEIPAPS